jgi:hypothetical protein
LKTAHPVTPETVESVHQHDRGFGSGGVQFLDIGTVLMTTPSIKLDSVLLMASDAAAMLNVSAASLSRWRSSGIGPTWIDLNGMPRYRREDIENWIEERAR